jgi:hypothetical protein
MEFEEGGRKIKVKVSGQLAGAIYSTVWGAL